MDDFLHTQTVAYHVALELNMATSRSSFPMELDQATLERISRELRALATSMVTRQDMKDLTTTLTETLRPEIAQIHTEVTSQGARLQYLDTATKDTANKMAATNLAISRQGALLLDMRRPLEDLDNRGRRGNIRNAEYRNLEGKR
ncbi:Hypothetical predicted protein, partial [Pelobates cultripes]